MLMSWADRVIDCGSPCIFQFFFYYLFRMTIAFGQLFNINYLSFNPIVNFELTPTHTYNEIMRFRGFAVMIIENLILNELKV